MTLQTSVALATASGSLSDEDADLLYIVDALRERGLTAEAVPWDEKDRDWSAFHMVVIRSTWDYCSRLEEFLAWSRRVSKTTLLRNPAGIIQWNSDKRYLASFAAQEVPVLPTSFVSPGEAVSLPRNGDFVVKPIVSAGARDTARYTQAQIQPARRHIERLHASGMPVMIQPYLTQINAGERALVFLNGQFSHAVRTGPVLIETGVIDNLRVAHPDPQRYEPSAEELQLAKRALAVTPVPPGQLLYARVDMVLDAKDNPLVMELELIEPDLFLLWSEAGPARFADAVSQALVRRE